MNNHPSGVQKGSTVRVYVTNAQKTLAGVVLSADNIGLTIACDPNRDNGLETDITKVDELGVPLEYQLFFVPWSVCFVQIGRLSK